MGEIPVKIQSGERAKFLLETEWDIIIESFDILTDDQVQPNDVCIFKALIVESSTTKSSIRIDIDIHSVEYIRKADRQDGAVEEQGVSADKQEKAEAVIEQTGQVDQGEGEIGEMMSHLDAA